MSITPDELQHYVNKDAGLLSEIIHRYKPRIVKPRTNLDLYGFSSVLVGITGDLSTRRTFLVNWQHGVYNHAPENGIRAYLSDAESLIKDFLVVVANTVDRDFLNENGFNNVLVAGLPFAYVKPANVPRANVLLAFPGHSSPSKNNRIASLEQVSYVQFLAQQKPYFDDVFICSYGLDLNQPLFRQASECGIKVILGAHPYDKMSLNRTRALFDSCSHVTTNSIGSHIFYALTCGCKVSFCGPSTAYTTTGDGCLGVEYVSADEITSRYQERRIFSDLNVNIRRLLTDSPLDGIVDVDMGHTIIGKQNVIHDRSILRSVLRWNLSQQLDGYACSLSRRLVSHVGQKFRHS